MVPRKLVGGRNGDVVRIGLVLLSLVISELSRCNGAAAGSSGRGRGQRMYPSASST